MIVTLKIVVFKTAEMVTDTSLFKYRKFNTLKPHGSFPYKYTGYPFYYGASPKAETHAG